MSNFSFFHSIFYPFIELSAIFIKFKIVIYKLWVWKNLKFIVWETVDQFMEQEAIVVDQQDDLS